MLETMKISFMGYPIKFHVVPDNFQILEEEILGNDFLGRYSAIINYETGQVECNGRKIQLKIRDSIFLIFDYLPFVPYGIPISNRLRVQ